MKINDVFTDDTGKPLQIIRVRHTPVVFDPFDDPNGLQIPDRSPPPVHDRGDGALGEDDDAEEVIPEEELRERVADKEAKARAEVLAIVRPTATKL
jgi:peptidyl-prolyl cis-trans isomerase-like 4